MERKQNLTVQLDPATIRTARILAAKRSTSISRLVAEQIEHLARAEDEYEAVRRAAIADLQRGYELGSEGSLPSRNELYHR